MDYSGLHNGRPCKACTSAEELMRFGKKKMSKKDEVNLSNEHQKDNSHTSSTSNSVRTDISEEESLNLVKRLDCPIDKDVLGNSTWNLLHTMSVYYPEKPDEKNRGDMKNMLESLSKVCIFIFFYVIYFLKF